MEAAFENIVGQLAAHGGHGIETSGFALIQNELVDQCFQHQQALQVLGVGKLGVIAGIVEHLAPYRILQELIGGLQTGELIGVATTVGMGRLGNLAISRLDRRLVGIALHAKQNIGIDHKNTFKRKLLPACLIPSPQDLRVDHRPNPPRAAPRTVG
ncbi:hypothetical protein D3C80_889850 [compost metagenome]